MSAPEGLTRSNVAPAPSGRATSRPTAACPPRCSPGPARRRSPWRRSTPHGRVAWVNPAFEALTGFAAAQARRHGRRTAARRRRHAAVAAAAGELARRRLQRQDGVPLHCDVQVDAVDAGLRLLTLVSRDAEAESDAEIRRLAALLDFVQSHARIGLWERNVRTREGRWDPHMFRFFGIDPRRGTPSIAQIAQSSVPQDRLFQALNDSMDEAGNYSHRYRLLTPDGRAAPRADALGGVRRRRRPARPRRGPRDGRHRDLRARVVGGRGRRAAAARHRAGRRVDVAPRPRHPARAPQRPRRAA